MSANYKQLVSGLSDEQLADLHTEVAAGVEGRRKKIDLNDIRPGMSKEDEAAAWGEMQRALKEWNDR